MEPNKVPTFSYYMMEIVPMDIIPRAGDNYDNLPETSKFLIDKAIERYIEWLSKIHHGIIENPIK